MNPRNGTFVSLCLFALSSSFSTAFASTVPVTLSFDNVSNGSFSTYTEANYTFQNGLGGISGFSGTNTNGALGSAIVSGQAVDGHENNRISFSNNSGAWFQLLSFDLYTANGPLSYTVYGAGPTNGNLFQPFSGVDNTIGSWVTVTLPVEDQIYVSSARFSLTDNGPANSYYAIDNLSILPAPEPSSLMLLGTGMLSAGALLRRRAQR